MVLGFLLSACSGGQQQNNENSDEGVSTEQSTADEGESSKAGAISDCDEFLDRYEEWTEDYLDVVEAYMKDPTNITLSQEYLEVAESAATWSQEWVNYISCAREEKYQKRYDEISDKIEKRMKELGLDE